MTEKEKKEFHIAMCKCCLLAQAMKTCQACCFNIGLDQQVETAEPIPVPIPVQIPIFSLSD